MAVQRTAGLLLAAGAGRRFGGPKAVVEVDGERLVDRAVRVLRLGGADPVVVVLGAAVVDVPTADLVVVARDWEQGMGASLRTGLAALAELPADVTGAAVLLVDLPDMTAAAVRELLTARQGPDDLLAATYDGQQGHPVVLGRHHWTGAAASAQGDRGARQYLAEQGVRGVPCEHLASGHDADEPAHLEPGPGLLQRLRGDLGSSAGGLAAGLGPLAEALGGTGVRRAAEERRAEELRRDEQGEGAPPRADVMHVDLDAGTVRLPSRGSDPARSDPPVRPEPEQDG